MVGQHRLQLAAGVEEARFGSAHRHLLHLGDLGEGQPLDEKQLRGEPLVGRQKCEGLADREAILGAALGGGLDFDLAVPGSFRLLPADPVGAAAPQNAEGPRGETRRVAQTGDTAQD